MSTDGRVLKGVLTFHSETGTEGGHWAFQDERFIKKNVPRGWCKKCGKWLRVKPGVALPQCSDGEHQEDIADELSYEGLHILKDGDCLTIFAKDDSVRVVWEGTIKLHRFPPFAEHAFGLWIHDDQEGILREEWAQWFFKEYPAKLVVT